jgi:hypothetical protein
MHSKPSVLPLELFLLIAHLSDDASILALRATSHNLNDLVTPLAFRTLLVKLRRGCPRARLDSLTTSSDDQASFPKKHMRHLAHYFRTCRIEMGDATATGEQTDYLCYQYTMRV